MTIDRGFTIDEKSSLKRGKKKPRSDRAIRPENVLSHPDDFDEIIGRLNRVLSILVLCAKSGELDTPNKQTLKHQAEDMIAAGEKILSVLKGIDGTPQPK